MVSTTVNSKRGYVTRIGLFALLLMVFGIGLQSVFAEAISERQAKQQKADSYIRIAQEQTKRGLYQQAQVLITQIRENFTPYLSDSQAQTLQALSDEVNRALTERQKITVSLQRVEELSAAGQYQQALTLLQEIKALERAVQSERGVSAHFLLKEALLFQTKFSTD